MNAQQKTAVDVVALLTEAGDPNAPEGTRARMLADAGAAVAEAVEVFRNTARALKVLEPTLTSAGLSVIARVVRQIQQDVQSATERVGGAA